MTLLSATVSVIECIQTQFVGKIGSEGQEGVMGDNRNVNIRGGSAAGKRESPNSILSPDGVFGGSGEMTALTGCLLKTFCVQIAG